MRGLLDATTNEAQLRGWWDTWPLANIGIATGSSALIVLDIDPDNGGDYTIAELLAQHEPLPDTVEAITSSGGRHIFFRANGEGIRNSAGKLGSGLDIRGEGGYIVAAPSLHRSGGRYEWEASGHPDDTDLASVPNWLRALLIAPKPASVVESEEGAAIVEGRRNDFLTRVGGKLRQMGWGESEILSALLFRNDACCNPPLPGDEVAQVAHSVMRYEPMPVPHMALVPPTDRRVDNEGGFSRSFVPSLQKIPVSPFPVEAIPGALRTLVEEGAAALDVPPDFIAVPALVFAAGCIGRTRAIELKQGFQQFPVLFSATIGPPSSGKTPGQSFARKAIDRLQSEAYKRYNQENAAYEESLQDLKQTPPEKRGRPPVRPELEHYFTTDPTIEALADMLTTSPGIVNARDELVSWVKSMDAYRGGKGGDRQRWLSGWSSDPWKVDRKGGKPIHVPHPTICVVGGMQPDVLSELSHEAGSRDGFIERILWSYPDADLPGWTEVIVPNATFEEVYQQFATLRASGSVDEPLVVTLSPDAKGRFVAWHEANTEQVKRASGLLQGYYAKLPQQLARLALVLHCLHWQGRASEYRVTLETMAGAIALVEYFRSHALRVLPAFGKVTHEEALAEKVFAHLRESGEWVPRSALHDAFNRNLGKGELAEALRQLEEQGRVEMRSVPTAGRSREEWRAIRNE